MIAGLLGVLAFVCIILWVAFSFYAGGLVKDLTANDGWATLTCILLLFSPVAFLVGFVLWG